jgi:dipeptidyl aminopeptidase/acylaminoacyl peptidase
MSKENQESSKVRIMTPEAVVAMKGLGEAAISPDGKWSVFVQSDPILEAEKSEYQSHIWLVSTDGGHPIQLTNGPNGDHSPRWSSDSKRLAFVSKRNSDKEQVWLISMSGGEARQLTYAKNGAANPRWSPDGKRILFLMQEKDSETQERQKKAKEDPILVGKNDFKPSHLWAIDVETIDEAPELLFTIPDAEPGKDHKATDSRDKSRRLTEGDFHVSDPQWSPDGERIAFVSARTPKADDTMFGATVHILDVETKQMRKLTPHDGNESSPRWSPDGKQIAFLYYPKGYGQYELYVTSVDGGSPTHLTSDFNRSIDAPVWSSDGRFLYFRAMDGVRRHLYCVSKDGGAVRQATQGDGVIDRVSIADDGEVFLCSRSTPTTPPDLWLGSIQTGEMKRLTQLNPQMGDFTLGETRVIHWKSQDGLEIEGLLCLPVGYEPGKRCPLYVEPHGGPRTSRDLSFRPDWQCFSGEGFAVFVPNFRGGDGYGRDFARANESDWGGGDYQDIMTGVDDLIQEGVADPERLVVGGWSYGGYMTCWIITQTDRFKAAMNGCGVTNLVSMYGQTDIPTFMRLYLGDGAPAQQLELYRQRSPVSYIRRVKTPTLILHGVEDRRVPLPQSEEFYAGLKSIGVEVELVKYPREGHGIGEPRHRLDALKRQLAWFKKYI